MKSLGRAVCLVAILALTHGLIYRMAAQRAPSAKLSKQVRQISDYQWVDKKCRIFTNDKIGIDVDQTCLEVRTVIGGLVVIPNPHDSAWAQEVENEIGKPQAQRDKWIVRFYDLGGGKLSRP